MAAKKSVKKTKKKQEFRTIFTHCKVKKDSTNTDNRALICQYRSKSKAFHITELADAIRWVQINYDITIDIPSIKIPNDITDIMHEKIEEELHNIMKQLYVHPFQNSINYIIQLHGDHSDQKLTKCNRSPEEIVYSRDDDGDIWFYQYFDYEYKSILKNNDENNDEKKNENFDANDYRIFEMSPRLPHLRNLWIEYNGPFSMYISAQHGTDIIIKTLKGGMMLTLGDNEPYHLSVFRSVYIRQDIDFSYTMDRDGGLIEFTFSNTQVFGMSYDAFSNELESKMARLVIEENENNEDEHQNDSD